MRENDRNDDERPIELDALAPEIPPSPVLEARVVAELGRRGQLVARPRRPAFLVLALVAALAFAAFLAGHAVGRRSRPSEPAAASNPRFVLFLEPLPDEMRGDLAHEPGRVAEYRNWATSLRRAGRTISGEKSGPDPGASFRGVRPCRADVLRMPLHGREKPERSPNRLRATSSCPPRTSKTRSRSPATARTSAMEAR